MNITPLEIRQKVFEKQLRGFDKDEVNAFLQSLSLEWERFIDENKTLKLKLESTEKEVQKLREVESSLFKTLKTAEDTGANVIEQATKAADLHFRETQWKAETLINEAKTKAKNLLEEAEGKSRRLLNEMEDELKNLEREYKYMENEKDNLVEELESITSDIVKRVKKVRASRRSEELSAEMDRKRNQTESEVMLANKEQADKIQDKVEEEGSFFDEIE